MFSKFAVLQKNPRKCGDSPLHPRLWCLFPRDRRKNLFFYYLDWWVGPWLNWTASGDWNRYSLRWIPKYRHLLSHQCTSARRTPHQVQPYPVGDAVCETRGACIDHLLNNPSLWLLRATIVTIGRAFFITFLVIDWLAPLPPHPHRESRKTR